MEEEDDFDDLLLSNDAKDIDKKNDKGKDKEEKKEDILLDDPKTDIKISVAGNNTPLPTNSTGTDTQNETEQDKLLLIDMGFDKLLVNKIYSTVFPQNIDEAIDYLQKDKNDKFTHSYIANTLNVCSICGKLRTAHANESLLMEQERVREEERERQRQRERRERLLNNFGSTNTYSSTNKYNTYSKSDFGKKECGVCSDDISEKDKIKVRIPCKHYFCLDCWTEYLKEKINNANVYKISCMEHKCGYILEEKFVKSIIGSDSTLVEKYDKFLSRKKLMDSNKKIKFCPIPDCDGYAEKKKSKYVKCNFGHEFCFECGQQPHGKKKCAKVIDEGFEEWKSHTLVKRCTYCKFWTEKNEGCNHMTC